MMDPSRPRKNASSQVKDCDTCLVHTHPAGALVTTLALSAAHSPCRKGLQAHSREAI